MTFAPLSEPDYDRQHAEAPAGPMCSRCGCRAELSVDAEPDDYPGIQSALYACPTDGEFYEDREGFSIRQVFLDDSAPTHAVPVEVATEPDGEIDF